MIFMHKIGNRMEPVLQIPPAEDKTVKASVSKFINDNSMIYQQIVKVEEKLSKEFLISGKLTYDDINALTKVLSAFESVDVGHNLNLDLSLKCDLQLYEALKNPSSGSLEIVETNEEQVYLFGNEYIIKEQRVSILSPVIENADEVGKALLLGKEAIAKIVSSTGKLIMQCKF